MLFRSDRKSTRLNSSHTIISYAVFCLKKKRSEEHTSELQSHDNLVCRLMIEKKSIKFMLAPKSHSSLLNLTSPIMHGIEKLPCSFFLGGNFSFKTSLLSSASISVS